MTIERLLISPLDCWVRRFHLAVSFHRAPPYSGRVPSPDKVSDLPPPSGPPNPVVAAPLSPHPSSPLRAAGTTQNRSSWWQSDDAAARPWPQRPWAKCPRADTQTPRHRSVRTGRRVVAPRSPPCRTRIALGPPLDGRTCH